MARVLLAWLGFADIKAARGDPSGGSGPIAQAVAARTFDHVVLLDNMPKSDTELYQGVAEERIQAEVVLRDHALAHPTHYGDIHRVVVSTVAWVLEKYGKKTKLNFHFSPGTPVMPPSGSSSPRRNSRPRSSSPTRSTARHAAFAETDWRE